MNVTLSSFRAMAAAASTSSRDIVLGKDDGMDVAKLGRLGRWSILPHSRAMNRETMDAFRNALQMARGQRGADAFDAVLKTRAEQGKSLRAKDIRAVFEKSGQLELDRILKKNNLARAVMSRKETGREAMFGILCSEFQFEGHTTKMMGEGANRAVRKRLMPFKADWITPQDVDAIYRCTLEFETEDISRAIDKAIARHPTASEYPPDRLSALRTDIRHRVVDRLFTLRSHNPKTETKPLLKEAAAQLVDEVVYEMEGTLRAANALAAEQAAQNPAGDRQ